MARPVLRCVLGALLALHGALATAAGDVLAQRCEKLLADARVEVVFEDPPFTRDDTQDVQALRQLSRRAQQGHNRVLGLTHAELRTRTRLTARTVAEPSGRVCAVPSLLVTIGIDNFRVYLARELTDGCRRAIVDAHEMEHVAIWRTHLRAGAQLLTGQLRQELAEPLYFDSPAQARAGLAQYVEAKVARQLHTVTEGIRAAHAELDAPASYQLERDRLATCPPTGAAARTDAP